LTLAGSAASAPDGFRESVRLTPIAAEIAGKPVLVRCAQTFDAWAAQVAATGGGNPYQIGGYTLVADGETHLSPWTCQHIEGWLRGKNVPSLARFASSVLLLVHETVHLRGELDESVADCTALRELPGVLTRRFGIKRAVTRRAIMAAAWVRHRAQAEYRVLC
ncbi:MAG: hypothetical protein NUW01_11620, partial [Gemmatimonadaceae bacterium]|nr:hypothetical protein [Gemmatimonadaceae bacterium]